MAMNERKEAIATTLAAHGQQHVLRFWDELSHAQRRALLEQLEAIDFARLDRLIETLVLTEPAPPEVADLAPAPYVPLPGNERQKADFREMWSEGTRLIEAGKVAALTVAGGAGTRLGFDGPKGAFPISPVRDKTLFQLFAEYLLAVGRDHGVALPWYVMTSTDNHEQTVAFFQEHDFFGLAAAQVRFFTQGMMPVVDRAGRLLMESKAALALSPDGHGGTLTALSKSGALAEMQEAGVELLSYFQVDNPLVRCVDPAFVGYHQAAGARMSSKMVPKRHAAEAVGAFCQRPDGRTCVIEYSDLPAELAEQTDEAGRLRFRAGSIAIHLIDVAFAEALTAGGGIELPFHRAEKAVPCLDEHGVPRAPAGKNAIKFEQFIFDALPLAERVATLETRRSDEFAPVKNAEGADSPATARHDLIERAARWLEGVGVTIPRDGHGDCRAVIEISPLLAWHSGKLVDRVKPDMRVAPGEAVYLGSE